MPRRLYLEQFGPVHALPVLHYRMEFAQLVRMAVTQVRPDAIAIELPATLETPFLRALHRLPQISVISYQEGSESVYLLVEPADPLVEAARRALELNIPLHFIDADINSYPRHRQQLPDSYCVTRIGLEAYYREYLHACRSETADYNDRRREQGMAWRLQQLALLHQRILFVGGMAHIERVKQLFATPRQRRWSGSTAAGSASPTCTPIPAVKFWPNSPFFRRSTNCGAARSPKKYRRAEPACADAFMHLS
ncbi:MAG: hypothetical protein WCP10_03840 [Desulfuromonadales bacterium]